VADVGQLCAVSFNRYGRLFYFDPGPLRPTVGDRVLVPTDDGPEVGECIWAAEYVDEDTSAYPQLIGLAGADDLRRDEQIRAAKAEAKVAAKKLIREHGLPMKMVAVDHIPASSTGPPGAGSRTTIYFTAPHRVDFRSLVRDLGATLRCRVELRQLSARDSARVQGGIGSCGRDLCCATFLTDFEPVTIRMAKDQDLPLNPLRISGACGRLMCCLKYEHPLYAAASTSWPEQGERVDTPEGPGRVIGRNVPSETLIVRMAEDGRHQRCAVADVCGSRRAFERRPSADNPNPAQ
jgi:cell fate regulator YaaT (PSP1 superfamily)